jgi:thymidylate synthase
VAKSKKQVSVEKLLRMVIQRVHALRYSLRTEGEFDDVLVKIGVSSDVIRNLKDTRDEMKKDNREYEEEKQAWEEAMDRKYNFAVSRKKLHDAQDVLKNEVDKVTEKFSKRLRSIEVKVLAGKDEDKVLDQLYKLAQELDLVDNVDNDEPKLKYNPDTGRIEREYAEDKNATGNWENEER